MENNNQQQKQHSIKICEGCIREQYLHINSENLQSIVSCSSPFNTDFKCKQVLRGNRTLGNPTTGGILCIDLYNI